MGRSNEEEDERRVTRWEGRGGRCLCLRADGNLTGDLISSTSVKVMRISMVSI